MNKYKFLLPFLMLAVIFSSCEKDEYTGHSTLVPTTPTISVDFGTISTVTDDASSKHVITLNMDVAQIVDVAVHVAVSGDATEGEDFSISDHRVIIAAGRKSATLTVTVIADELAEATEKFKLTIGDARTANAKITPVSAEFTIGNATTDELICDMSWKTDVLTAVGLDLEPTEAVDLKMVIIHAGPDTIMAEVSAAGFKSFSEFNTFPDGDYIVATSILETIDAGDFNATLSIDVELEFNQLGVINGQVMSFSSVMKNKFACSSYRVELARITKTGNSYTPTNSLVVPSHLLAGEWAGIDMKNDSTDYNFPSEVVVEMGCGAPEVTGLGFGWMTGFWGEVIVVGGSVYLEIDEAAKTVNISDQFYMTTTYNGDVQPNYNIVGSGTYDDSGAFPVITIEYDLVQDGWSTAGWGFDNGYMSTELYVAELTLDPASKMVVSHTITKRPSFVKPVR